MLVWGHVTCSHGLGNTNMLTCCQAEMLQSGHAVGLKSPEQVPESGVVVLEEDCIVWKRRHLLVNLRWCHCLVGGLMLSCWGFSWAYLFCEGL